MVEGSQASFTCSVGFGSVAWEVDNVLVDTMAEAVMFADVGISVPLPTSFTSNVTINGTIANNGTALRCHVYNSVPSEFTISDVVHLTVINGESILN